MKLITSLTTPFGRKIRILLAEKGLPCEIMEAVPWDADSPVPDFNPLGKVPVLVRDDGSTLFDSRVIAGYLDGLAGPALIPAGGEARIQVLRWEALADGINDASVAVFLERKRQAAQRSDAWIERQLGKVRAGLEEATRQLQGDYCCGEFSMADIALIACLDYVQLRIKDAVALEHWPVLASYRQRLHGRESVASTAPPA